MDHCPRSLSRPLQGRPDRRGDHRTMNTIESDRATQSLGQAAREAAGEAVVVTEHGKPVAVLLPLENTDLETVSLSSNPRFLKLIERSRSRMSQEGGISSAEVRRRLGLT